MSLSLWANEDAMACLVRKRLVLMVTRNRTENDRATLSLRAVVLGTVVHQLGSHDPGLEGCFLKCKL
jgi:hypothetical protein